MKGRHLHFHFADSLCHVLFTSHFYHLFFKVELLESLHNESLNVSTVTQKAKEVSFSSMPFFFIVIIIIFFPLSCLAIVTNRSESDCFYDG